MRMLRPVGGVGGSGNREGSVGDDLGVVERLWRLGRRPGDWRPPAGFAILCEHRKFAVP
jgi:hypothetical protein